MATAKKLKSGSWRCQVYSHSIPVFDSNGKPVIDPKTKKQKLKRIYESFTCNDPSPKGKRQAEKEAAAWAADKENRTVNHKSNMTLGEALDQYILERSAVLSPATVREYKRSRKRDLQSLMDKSLRSITANMIQAAINEEALSHSPKTVRNMHGLLTAVMTVYRPDFAIQTKLPKKVRPKLRVPTDNDIAKLMNYIQGTKMEVPVLLAAFGPMRRSEICAVDTNHIERNLNRIHIEYAMVMDENRKWVLKPPKSYAGDRYIVFPHFVIEKITVTNGRITDLNPDQVTSRFIRILKKLDIPHFRFHDLRHYSASVQHAIGIPDAYIMQRGGWGNDSVLKEIYRHVMEDHQEDMNNIANNYFDNLCNTKCNTNAKTP